MAVERRDPVPPGRYSLFVLAAEADRFTAWVRDNPSRVKLITRVAKTRLSGDSEGFIDALFVITPTGKLKTEHVGDMVLFDVLSPVPWVGLGFPTIEKGVGSGDFAAREQPPPSGGDDSPFAEIQRIILMGAAAFGVFYLAGKFLEGKGARS